MKPIASLNSSKDQAVRTAEELLSSFVTAGPFPSNGSCDELLFWLLVVQHNCTGIIRYCQRRLEKPGIEDDQELFAALKRAKRRATEAFEMASKPLSRKSLRDCQRLRMLKSKYDNLGASVGSIFLLIAPCLAQRAEARF